MFSDYVLVFLLVKLVVNFRLLVNLGMMESDKIFLHYLRTSYFISKNVVYNAGEIWKSKLPQYF